MCSHKLTMTEAVTKKRKICFVITSRIHYSRNKLVLEKLRDNPEVELQIVIGGSAIIDRYGMVDKEIEDDGFSISARIQMVLDSSDPSAMAKSAGIGVIEFASSFERLQPDVVFIRGDRYEMLSATLAAAYMNITVAHLEGGDVTGSIDESVRHAITKLAHIHFVTNEDAKRRVLAMGENPAHVHLVGSPELEVVSNNSFEPTPEYVEKIGVGDVVDIKKPYIMVMQHAVTTEYNEVFDQIVETIEAVIAADLPTIWFWPNVDAGSDLIAKRMRQYREQGKFHKIKFIKYLPQEEFYGVLRKARCLVGNSSSGLKECSVLGVPVVNIGSRQDGRYAGHNVVSVPYEREEIKSAILAQVEQGKYPVDGYYHRPDTSDLITSILAATPLYTQKKFFEKV